MNIFEIQDYILVIIIGTTAGTVTRIVLLKVDYRQYPGYPHGYIVHVTLGFIASALGAVAIPAIIEKEFTAFTFLALAAQQFREIRTQERITLESLEESELIQRGKDYLEESELIQRGKDYIEGIAKTFEARNYLVMVTAFFTVLATQVSLAVGFNYIPGIITGIIALLITSCNYSS